MEIAFCCTNIDMYSLAEFQELGRLGVPVREEHCLGLCHYCARGWMALVGHTIVVADNASDFWLLLRPLLADDGTVAPDDHLGGKAADSSGLCSMHKGRRNGKLYRGGGSHGCGGSSGHRV